MIRDRVRQVSRARRPLVLVLVLVGSAMIGGGGARAQDRAADFAERPILVLDTGAHHAPVRRLVFTPDESRLLSAGDDKVVRVWDIKANPAGLAWTIRPPIWRGFAGAINAMALTAPDAQGNQTLALAGYGVQASRGEIGLYRFPGAVDRRQGDVVAVLAAGDWVPLPETKGHVNTVAGLAFSPDGRLLASCGNDTTVRLWDVRTRAQVALISPPGQEKVNGLAFTPDGRRLATGGSDGTLRVWDVTARPPVLVAQAAPPVVRPGDVGGLAINALDVSPDGRWVVIGREDGLLLRYDLIAPDFAGSRALFATSPQQGPVEGLAFGPKGRLVTAIIARRVEPTDRPTVRCDIQLWNVLDITRSELIDQASNLVYALAISPSGNLLAYAGGDRQDVKLVDLRVAPRNPLVDVSGGFAKGWSLWDIGFVGDAAVAFSYTQPTAPPSAVYWGFHLRDRARIAYSRDRVRRAVADWNGWTVRPVSPSVLDVIHTGAVAFRVHLSPDLDGRWWNHSFLPPGPGHPEPALAVACHRGVAVYRLADGVRTRFLDGHNGAVYCLAPSADGRWLATGSSDQTVRLWPLANLDRLAPLGADFEIRAGVLVVKSVEKGSFADVAGLAAGDLIDVPALEGKPVTARAFLDGYAQSPPNVTLQFRGRRRRTPPPGADPKAAAAITEEPVLAGTTKRDRPALSLFVGLDREWVLWTPRGFYDSSVIGDSTFLGWQVNRTTMARPLPTDFYPLLTHEKALRQPRSVPGNAIDRLLDAANEVVAFGPLLDEQEPAVAAERPARVTALLGAGGAPVRGPDGVAIAPGSPLPEKFSMPPGPLVVDWKVEPWRAQAPGPFEIRVEGRTVRAPLAPPFDPAVGFATVPMRHELADPGAFTVLALADGGAGHERRTTVTATVDGPPPRKPGHLRILAVAPTFSDPKIRPILASQQDADDLASFFARHLVTESGGRFSRIDPVGKGLTGGDATAARVMAALDAVGQGPVEPGDLAVVVIETHVLTQAKQSRLVVADSQGSPPDRASTVPAENVAAALEPLVRRGCKVIVVLDGVHETPGAAAATSSDVVEWVRSLRNQHDIITVLATTRRPIRDESVEVHRPLAQAILDSPLAPARNPADPLLSLADFRTTVVDRVLRLTKQKGEPAVYIPRGIDAGLPILTRKP